MSEQNEPMRVDTEMVKTLARLLDENGLSEIEVEDDGRRIVVKVMNPIPSPRSGVVKQILIQNAQPVEYEQPLAIIE